MSRLFISFSGGETSALMTRILLLEARSVYKEVIVLFANTGQENEETLEFVRECDQHFGFGTVWVEAVVHHGERRGSTHRVVDFESASRAGEPYEDVIKKYGIPNAKYLHCTRELKLLPMRSYLESLGWPSGTYDTAIGIRADEPKRRRADAQQHRIVYPLIDWVPMSKPQINAFWREQPFRLNLAGYQGNCKWCWKKSLRKLLTIIDDDPAIFDFPDRMERQYGGHVTGVKKEDARYRRVFFRGNLATKDLRQLHAEGHWERAENDAVVYAGVPVHLDVESGDGCTESCEVDWADQSVTIQ